MPQDGRYDDLTAFLDARGDALLRTAVLLTPSREAGQDLLQEALERLFLEPARRLPEKRFVIGGAQYPLDFPWGSNVFFVRHLPPADHPAFFAASPLTLNVTRAAMATMGYCPSGRLFEAAACGTAVLSDTWEGLDRFFEPGREIFTAETGEQAIEILSLPREEIARVARAARERTLAEHTAERRVEELVEMLGMTATPRPALAGGAWA